MLTVKEMLENIASTGSTPNRFNKKTFNELMKAMANDADFKARVAVVKGKELSGVEEIPVSKELRKFLKRVIEKAGIDKSESDMIMDESFTIDNVDGLYDFFCAAVYEYMAAGNTFNFPTREDFKGSMTVKNVPAGKKESEARDLHTKESMGWFEYTNQPYKALTASSPCPAYLKSRRKLHD